MYKKYEKKNSPPLQRRKHVVTPLIGTVKPLRQRQKLWKSLILKYWGIKPQHIHQN